jgi:hypothetical protein
VGGPNGLEPLTSALSARPGPISSKINNALNGPHKTDLTRDFTFEQLCHSLARIVDNF